MLLVCSNVTQLTGAVSSLSAEIISVPISHPQDVHFPLRGSAPPAAGRRGLSVWAPRRGGLPPACSGQTPMLTHTHAFFLSLVSVPGSLSTCTLAHPEPDLIFSSCIYTDLYSVLSFCHILRTSMFCDHLCVQRGRKELQPLPLLAGCLPPVLCSSSERMWPERSQPQRPPLQCTGGCPLMQQRT